MPNTAEWPIVLLGAMDAGILVSTVNPKYRGGKHFDTARIKGGRYVKVLLAERTTRELGTQVCITASRKIRSAV
jgi:acyl-CoA synthetase (AMP-forming)/AMP-acid ligase II